MKRLFAIVLLALWGLQASAAVKSPTIVYIDGAKYHIHTVQPGETLYALSKTYEVGEQVIVKSNPALADGLKAGATIRIPVVGAVDERMSERKLRKTFDTHIVRKGETLYAVSRRYEIPIQTILEDNPTLDPIRLRPDDRILIRKKRKGSADDEENLAAWEEYRRSLNSVAGEGVAYHMVARGETMYGLAKRFETTEELLSSMNGGLQAADLKAGAIIKVPTDGAEMTDEPVDSLSTAEPAGPTELAAIPRVDFRALDSGERLDIALLLPMHIDGKVQQSYAEFYRGFLLGLDSVRLKYGRTVHVTLFDTERNPERINEIVATEEFRRARLIVGPVYEEGLHPVVRFAEEHAVPVISPLANITKIRSDALFQMAPAPERKYAACAELFTADKRITLICTDRIDREFEAEVLDRIGDLPYTRYAYKYVHPSAVRKDYNPGNLTPLLENDDDNLFIVLADNETDVDRILAALASADTGLTSRGHRPPRFTVLGNARWNRYNNIDRTTFFKDRVVFVATYHAKRDAEVVAAFDSAYIRAFGALPSLYSYRAYDAAMIFVEGMYNDIQYGMEGRTFTPLQTTYSFGRSTTPGNRTNNRWPRVDYNANFTITVR